ncbi:centrosomal protein of 126 kDa isoform X2 [Phyllopteryx taeniolatus]|uniref:centrosomal protein of 126 kDa isoform X2 n=1 Tax=Phyllopteryx taeniolatus TaxID=161469 RepID=UPI002AD4EE76|nr:centrosomal protein of 126 kDa isoform X2 [Phyllopteryx taeniolatus]
MSSLQQERDALLDEQKVNRERARRCVRETNRRCRDLREKQRLWVLQEQRRREEVLQRRRQKFQDVTEHFQRAYLPPSQRPTQCERLTAGRDDPDLEDALGQIRGPVLPSNLDSQTISAPSSRPAGALSESPLRRTPVAVQASVGRREQSPCAGRWQELPKRQERHREHSGQDDNVSRCSKSDSLSSQDSLENEEAAKSAVLQYSEKPLQDLKCPNDPHPVSSAPGPTLVAVKPHFHRLPVDLNYNLPTQKETRASMNNLNKFSADIDVWKHMNTASPKCRQSQESSGSKTSSPAACRVQFMKGILKTLPGETPAESPQVHANAVKPVQFLVCDSIEVARARSRSKAAEYKNASKKLRWLDEEAGVTSGVRPTDAQSQAWADVGVQVSAGVADHSAGVGASPVSSGFVAQSPVPVAGIRGESRTASKHGSPTKGPYGGDQARVSHQLAPPPPEEVPHKDTQRLMTGDARLPSSFSRPAPESSWKASPAFGHPATPGGGGRGRGASYGGKVLDRTPTDSDIYQLCQDVRSAFISAAGQRQDPSLVVSEKAGTPCCQALTSGRAGNKSGADQNRRPSGSTDKKPPEFFKMTCLHATNPVGPSPKGHFTEQPNKGPVKTASQRRLTDTYSCGPPEERVGKPQRTTSRPHRQQYRRRPPAATSISVEEQRIFQSLDRLNCQLHRKSGLH